MSSCVSNIIFFIIFDIMASILVSADNNIIQHVLFFF